MIRRGLIAKLSGPEDDTRARERLEASSEDFGTLVLSIIDDARMGNKAAARALLDVFWMHEHFGARPPRALMAYLAEAFELILDGKKPARALSMAAPRNRPNGGHELMRRHSEISSKFETLRAGGMSYESAIGEIADRPGRSERTVRRAVKRYSATTVDQLHPEYWVQKDRKSVPD